MERGEKLLKAIGKCTEKYFLEHCDEVLNCDISLVNLADNFKVITEVEKVYSVLTILENFESVDSLKAKFEVDQMEYPLQGLVQSNAVSHCNNLRM